MTAIALPLAPASVSFAATAPDNTLDRAFVRTQENDPELLQAEAQARRTLPQFWKLLAKNPRNADAFSVKACFETAKGFVDCLWLINLKRQGDHVTASVDNQPDGLPNLHVGSSVTISQSQIIDWIVAMDRQYGHFTTRVLAKRHPKEAEALKSILSATPLPPGMKDPGR